MTAGDENTAKIFAVLKEESSASLETLAEKTLIPAQSISSLLIMLELERKVQEQEELQRTITSLQQTLTAIPPEIIAEYNEPKPERKEPIAIE